MDNDDRIRQILALALSTEPGRRQHCVEDACSGDVQLQRDVERLLALYPSLSDLTSSTRLPTATITHPPQPLADGRDVPASATVVWGRFIVLQRVGRGGFGIVYRAWDPQLEREVALKVLDPTNLARAAADEWLREGQVMARIRHPSVLTVYDAQRSGTEVGLVMEFVRGRTLASLVVEQGPLSAEEATVIGIALCDALSAVHASNLVHRDVKASNVMRESGGRIVLMDFGAGRDLRAEHDRQHVVGTPLYMAPEVLLGERPTTEADIYSLGVLLYHLVTGSYPIEEHGIEDLQLAHVSGTRIALGDRRSTLPMAFVDAVERALSPEADDRPASTQALKRELSKSGVIDVVPPPEPIRRTELLQRYVVGVAGFVTLATVIGFLTTSAFNITLGRTGDFADEPVWSYPMLGIKALVGPVVYLAIVLLLLETAGSLFRLVGRAVPPLHRMSDAAVTYIRAPVIRWRARDPNAFVRTVSVVGLVALCAIVLIFRTTILGYFSDIDTAPFDALIQMGPAHRFRRFVYRRTLEVLMLGVASGLLAVWRNRSMRRRLSTHSLVEAIAVLALPLLLATVPWRIMYAQEFPQYRWGLLTCSAIASDTAHLLLHCPSLTPPRNRTVPRSDTTLHETGRVASVYDEYVPRAQSDR